MNFFTQVFGPHLAPPTQAVPRQRVVIHMEAGAVRETGNFSAELAQLESSLSRVLYDHHLGIYCATRVHPDGTDMEMAGADGQRIVAGIEHVLKLYAVSGWRARVEIRDGRG